MSWQALPAATGDGGRAAAVGLRRRGGRPGRGVVASQWRLGLQLLRREGFSGELRWFVLALALSVACVLSGPGGGPAGCGLKASGATSSGRIGAALRTPAPADRLARASQEGLAVQTTVSFNSMLFHGDGLQLASIRAVPGTSPSTASWSLIPSAPLSPARSGSPPGDAAARRQGGGRAGGRQHPAEGVAASWARSRIRASALPDGARALDPQRRCGGDRRPPAGQPSAVALPHQGLPGGSPAMRPGSAPN